MATLDDDKISWSEIYEINLLTLHNDLDTLLHGSALVLDEDLVLSSVLANDLIKGHAGHSDDGLFPEAFLVRHGSILERPCDCWFGIAGEGHFQDGRGPYLQVDDVIQFAVKKFGGSWKK